MFSKIYKLILLISLFFFSANAYAQYRPIYDLEFSGEDDLLKARLLIEKEIYPEIDIEAVMSEIESLEKGIREMPSFDETTDGKLNALINYFYRSGEWNNNRPYRYDFSDPLGDEHSKSRMLSFYIKNRAGNCVSMPILLLVLGKRLGLDVYLSFAPSHFFIKLRENNLIYNIEATAGGLKSSRSYIEDFLITDEALKSGIYMEKLNYNQTLGAMYYDLIAHYIKINDIQKAQKTVDRVLELNPKSIYAIIMQGNIYWHKMDNTLKKLNAEKKPLTKEIKVKLDGYTEQNNKWFSYAESLGWREPPKDYDRRYLEMIEKERKKYESAQ